MMIKFGSDEIEVDIPKESLKDLSDNPDTHILVRILTTKCKSMFPELREAVASKMYDTASSIESQIKAYESVIDFIEKDLSDSLRD